MNRSTPETIDVVQVQYVREHPGLWFCDLCLATLIKNDSELRKRALTHVSGKPFQQTEGLCSRCGKRRTVIGLLHPE
jgi:hypothetical protein